MVVKRIEGKQGFKLGCLGGSEFYERSVRTDLWKTVKKIRETGLLRVDIHGCLSCVFSCNGKE